jgi:oligopeptide transport system substrate-binding protein
VQDPDDPASLLNRTITPAAFTTASGKDFTQYGSLKAISDRDGFNSQQALSYKAQALPELQAAGAKLPIKILMPYNPVVTNWDKECQIIEQQLETLLGKDYIDIVVEAGPSTGFLAAVRRSGKYALMKSNWGADYQDPDTWAEPFRAVSNNYNFMANAPNEAVDGKPSTSKTAATLQVVNQYYALVQQAKAPAAEAARYTAYAEAEAFLINHALVIPFSIDTAGYVASKIPPFDGPYAPFGLSIYRYKGIRLLDKAMSNTEYIAAYQTWLRERAAALAQ